MKIVHEKEKCIGCGACASVCPDFFEIGEDGKANLLGSKVNQETKNQELEIEEEDCVKEASSACPVGIIHIEE